MQNYNEKNLLKIILEIIEFNNYSKNFYICDWLCENPPCSHTNFDLFLGLQSHIAFT